MKKILVVVLWSVGFALPASAATCDGLRSLKLTNVVITASEVVGAGKFNPPDPSAALPAGAVLPTTDVLAIFRTLPAFCRAQGVLRPSNDSHIEFEVWLPASDWNERFLGVGNGGAAGSIPYDGIVIGPSVPGLAQALRDGFAAAATDTGHQGTMDDYSFGQARPERRIDYYHRAIHETAVAAKEVVRAFYGVGAKYSYFWGRSTGGGQALHEVQRYSADYDGVLAAAPALDRAATLSAWIWTAHAFAAEARIRENELPIVHAAVMTACDTVDGLEDGIIGAPTACRFDPDVLLCETASSVRCLSELQVAALKKYYDGPRNSSGERVALTFPLGAEPCAAQSMTCEGAAARRSSNWLVLLNSRWNVHTFNFDRDPQALAEDPDARLWDARESNLRPFMERGGKLIMEHGWSDGTAIPMNTVKYYERVVAAMGQNTVDGFVRLYMVPGMLHNGGSGPQDAPTGPATSRFEALQRWVETGVAPGAIVATKYRVDGDPASGVARTRPLCPFPQVAGYDGRGSIDDARNFSCKAP